MPGVGVSFGIDRICDVLEELNLFGQVRPAATQVLVCALSDSETPTALEILAGLRTAGIAAEVYPDTSKLKKALSYADKLEIPFAAIVGSDEMLEGVATVRNLATGMQSKVELASLAKYIKSL